MKPPLRLRDDPATPPELLSDLERSAAALPNYDVAAGLTGLHAAIANASPAPSPQTAVPQTALPSSGLTGSSLSAAAAATKAGSPAIAGAGAVKLALAISVAATGVAALVVGVWPRSSSAPAHEPKVASSAPSSKPAPKAGREPAPAVATPAARPLRDSPAPLPARLAPAPQAAINTSATASASAQASWRREIAQLGRIKVWVHTDPARAYDLAQAGHQEFGRGMLREEREALAVLALWNMGSRAQAQREAKVFLQRYPESPLRAPLERLLNEDR